MQYMEYMQNTGLSAVLPREHDFMKDLAWLKDVQTLHLECIDTIDAMTATTTTAMIDTTTDTKATIEAKDKRRKKLK